MRYFLLLIITPWIFAVQPHQRLVGWAAGPPRASPVGFRPTLRLFDVPRTLAIQPPQQFSHKSPLAVWVDEKGERAYVVLHTQRAVALVDLRAGKVQREIPVDADPVDMAVTDGTVYVACAKADSVVLIDRASNTVRRRIAVGQEPRAIWTDPAGKRVFVACHDEQTLCWWEEEAGPVQKLELPSCPQRIAGRHGSSALSIITQRGAEWLHVAVKTTDKPTIDTTLVLSKASNVRGLGKAQDATVLVHQRPRNLIAATQIAQGWVFTNALTLVRDKDRLGTIALLDEPQRGFADPSDVIWSHDSKRLYVAASGTDTVAVIDVPRMQQHTAQRLKTELPPGSDAYRELPDDLTSSRHYVLARLNVESNPRRLAACLVTARLWR